MKSLTVFSILAVMFLGSFSSLVEEGWSLSRDKEGVKIYTKKYKDYNYKEYKGIVIVDGKPSDLMNILKDITTYDKWSFNCIANSAEVLNANESADEYHIYMEIKAPVVANRDVVAIYKFHEAASDGSMMVEFKADADYIPKKKGLIRVPELVGYWKAIPMEGGKMKIVHQAFSHPGGNPPASLVNGAAVNAPYSMLRIIRDMIEK